MPKVLFSGSRHATPLMLSHAQEWVEKIAGWDGYTVVCGDAEGVDAAVIRACTETGVYFECYGITPASRGCIVSTQNYTYLNLKSYPDRDRHMASLADYGIFFWNGFSKGTIVTYNAMLKLKKLSLLYNYKDMK